MADIERLEIATLGECHIASPLHELGTGDAVPRFATDLSRIVLDDHVSHAPPDTPMSDLPSLELAGPRALLYFDPAQIGVGIVTCGGLCPGLNDVIRGLVMIAWHRYGVRRIVGFRYGYRGFTPSDEPGHQPLQLTPELVSEIHERGGSVLASSRGQQETGRIVDRLVALNLKVLFCIGGDGTLRGALDIASEVERRGLDIAVIGIPKTIDNDISYIDQSFGFQTAYTAAVEAIQSAHNEARGTLNGIGLVKVMGRHSGFLACHAALATSHVNFCLIPEMPLGPHFADAFADALHDRLRRRRHAVVLVAEGFGQDQLQKAGQLQRDASGNVKLIDIGPFLAQRIHDRLGQTGIEFSLKYIDPSYMVRSLPAIPSDSVYCWQLAQSAVHAAMAGKTRMIVGRWHNRMVHVPIDAAISRRKLVDPQGDLWLSVLETTGQPAAFG